MGKAKPARRIARKFTGLAFGVWAALAAPGCHDRDSPHPAGIASPTAVGSINLALALAPELNIGRVGYRITGNGIPPIEGAVDVSAAGATVSLFVGGIPAGGGYLITLTATGAELPAPALTTACVGTARFDITPGLTSQVAIEMLCTDPDQPGPGSVVVTATTNNCPIFTGFSIAPLVTGVGGTIAVSSAARDPDPGTSLLSVWSTNGTGVFHNPTAASTTLTCVSPGPQLVRITVTDGYCSKSREAIVTCTAPAGGGDAAADAAPAAPDVTLEQ